MRKTAIFIAVLCSLITAKAQEVNPLYDLQPVHFGFSILGNSGKLKFTTSEEMRSLDTLQRIKGINYPGFGVGGVMNVRLADYWDFRTMVNIQFVERQLDYYFNDGRIESLQISSTYMEIPLQLKYKSKRHKNTRVYVIGGTTYRFDFASDINTERSDTKPIVALQPNSFSYDLGIGLDLYFPYFKFSPEFRVSNTLGNSLVDDPYFFSNALNRINPKLIQFILHFEG